MKTLNRRLTLAAPLSVALLTAGTGLAIGSTNGSATAGSMGDDTLTVSPSEELPPGMIDLKGGKVTMGSTPKAIEELMTNASNQKMIRVLDGETPEHSSRVGSFAIGKYEVTNEQYLEYVKATGKRPPENWAGKALDEARAAFGKAEAEKAMADKSYDRQKWDEAKKDAWWRSNWQEVDWAIPEGQEAMPVCYIDFDDAVGYARWAGLRLPTEEEWVFAARSDKKSVFPWGDDWNGEKRAHTSETGSEKPRPVGSFPDGASPFGVQDMAGSVWEWTADPYNPFKDFKPNTYKFKKSSGKEKVTPEPNFNSSFRIIKGGSPQVPMLAARIATRQGAKRTQTTNAVGMRVASSVTPGVDRARAIWETDVQPSQARTQGEVFDFDGVVALDRWSADTPDKRADGYSVIKGYDHILFAPRNEFETTPGGELNRESRKQPVVLGIFATTVPILEPALAPGTYFVAYREKGRMMVSGAEEMPAEGDEKKKEGDDEGEGEDETPEAGDEIPLELLTPAERLLRQIDLKKDLLIFTTVDTGEYVTSMEFPQIKTDVKATKADDGEIIFSKKAAFDENKEKIQEDWMKFKANIRRSSSRVIPIEFDMKVDGAALGTKWRTERISPTGK
ncbi:formylglycine-generating enzyme family protein [Saltatorellus ferox]